MRRAPSQGRDWLGRTYAISFEAGEEGRVSAAWTIESLASAGHRGYPTKVPFRVVIATTCRFARLRGSAGRVAPSRVPPRLRTRRVHRVGVVRAASSGLRERPPRTALAGP